MGGLTFPLMSDFWPHGKVAALYGELSSKGYANRSVYLIDKKGIIRWIERVDPAEMPNNEQLFEQLQLLQD